MHDTIHQPLEDLRDKFGQATGLGDTPERNPGITKSEAVVAFAAATASTFVMREALEAVWRKSVGQPPPKNPASHTVSWKEALLWGALSGAVIGAARIASRRTASGVYRR
ncbi:hypothetical protein Mal15_29910 [Stieleria maiorica]|uniref:DUF4235 domain-containing protein n=1 Tax=Stieleria maiorica TaxID=2795974 RepID=A0A5B9MDQ7_9BACT|nr:DUF4235 domain-containing protein [Stieleria maiorica]QEF98933.1 hypothetical protein Mal15_29910 [Stieleria maiorica]